MNERIYLAAWIGLAVLFAPDARAQDYDRIHLPSGQSLPARISEITPDKVVVQQTGGLKEYPVNEIRFIQFSGEPRELLDVRNAAIDGNYERVIETLDKIPAAQLGASAQVRQEVDYYRALAKAKLAAKGVGDINSAGAALVNFIRENKSSHHFYEANEVAGNLLMAIDRPGLAVDSYRAVAAAPWPATKMRALILVGRALQAQGKHSEAVEQFDAALAIQTDDEEALAARWPARVGKAVSMVANGKVDEGIAAIREVIEQAPADDLLVHAIAYNALGNAYRKQGRPKEALYAFLHVDTLFNQNPDQHAEALANLTELWRAENHPERAQAAAELLETRYPYSRWK